MTIVSLMEEAAAAAGIANYKPTLWPSEWGASSLDSLVKLRGRRALRVMSGGCLPARRVSFVVGLQATTSSRPPLRGRGGP